MCTFAAVLVYVGLVLGVLLLSAVLVVCVVDGVCYGLVVVVG